MTTKLRLQEWYSVRAGEGVREWGDSGREFTWALGSRAFRV